MSVPGINFKTNRMANVVNLQKQADWRGITVCEITLLFILRIHVGMLGLLLCHSMGESQM